MTKAFQIIKTAICFACLSPLQLLPKAITFLLKADRVFDGENMHENWKVLVRIISNEVRTQISKGADVIKIQADYHWRKNGNQGDVILLHKHFSVACYYKTTLYILTILSTGQIFAETKKAEDFGFRHIQTIYQGYTSLYFS